MTRIWSQRHDDFCFNPLTPTVAIWVYSYKASCGRRIKPSFVIFDIRALWRWASECPNVKNYKWWLNPVWYSCTHMATLGVKGLIDQLIWLTSICSATISSSIAFLFGRDRFISDLIRSSSVSCILRNLTSSSLARISTSPFLSVCSVTSQRKRDRYQPCSISSNQGRLKLQQFGVATSVLRGGQEFRMIEWLV